MYKHDFGGFMEKEQLSVSETARAWGVNLDTVYKQLAAGKLLGIKRDGRWYIPANVVEERLSRRAESGYVGIAQTA
jgi:hypothetical protein